MKKIMLRAALALVLVGFGFSACLSAAPRHMGDSVEDKAVRNRYNKVWWGGMGAMGAFLMYQLFANYKLQQIQNSIIALKNEITAAESEVANEEATEAAAGDGSQDAQSEEAGETAADRLEELREELAAEEAKLSSYKKQVWLCLAGVLAGAGASYYANYKVTGNAFESWREAR